MVIELIRASINPASTKNYRAIANDGLFYLFFPYFIRKRRKKRLVACFSSNVYSLSSWIESHHCIIIINNIDYFHLSHFFFFLSLAFSGAARNLMDINWEIKLTHFSLSQSKFSQNPLLQESMQGFLIQRIEIKNFHNFVAALLSYHANHHHEKCSTLHQIYIIGIFFCEIGIFTYKI